MTADGPGNRAPRPGPRIGLALGGGSARGLAHVPMLEAFDELGLKPAVIAGTSMGAICGAAYAAGYSGARLREEFRAVLGRRRDLLKRLTGNMRGGLFGLWHPRDNVTLLEMLLPDAMRRSFDTLEVPFLAIATDYYGIAQVILDNGPLIPALAASSALPHLSRPVVIGGRVLIDGGYVNPVPYDVIMNRADVTVAVDVTGDTRIRPGTAMPSTLAAMTGATQILFHSITREKLKVVAPHVFIRPEVGAFGALEFFRIEEIFRAAEPSKQLLKNKLSQLLAKAG
jgi:NTE family protein